MSINLGDRESIPINLGDGKSVLEVTLTDITSGQEVILFHRHGSRCSFEEDIVHGPFIIALRIDWGHLKDGEPLLKADAFHNVNGKRGGPLEDKKRPWHHTPLSSYADYRCYDFVFPHLHLRLIAAVRQHQSMIYSTPSLPIVNRCPNNALGP